MFAQRVFRTQQRSWSQHRPARSSFQIAPGRETHLPAAELRCEFSPAMRHDDDDRLAESKGHLMAQVTNVKLLDDLDGTKAAEKVSFGLDGVGYEIDLNAKNAKALRKALGDFVAAGRHVKAAAPASVARSASRSRVAGPDAASIRQWANEAGVPVSGRGRVSADVRAKYLAATSQ